MNEKWRKKEKRKMNRYVRNRFARFVHQNTSKISIIRVAECA